MSRLGDFFNTGGQYEHSPMMHVQDQKPTGTDGGASVVGDNPRNLNTVLTNEITGASLGSNAVTLPAGEYYVECTSFYRAASFSKLFLKNASGDTLLESIASGGNSTYAADANVRTISGKITLTVTTVLSIALRVDTVHATGLGSALSYGSHEAYTDLMIWQLDAIKTSPIFTDNKLYPLPGNVMVTGNMYGLDYSKTGANTISVGAGVCMDSTNGTMLTLDAGVSVNIPTAINTIYNLFLQSDGTIGVDTDVNGTTLGTVRRWIGFVLTGNTGEIIEFLVDGSGKFTFSTLGAIFVSAAMPAVFTQYDLSPFIPITRTSDISIAGISSGETQAIVVSADGVTEVSYKGGGGNPNVFGQNWYLRALSINQDNASASIFQVTLLR